MENTENTKTKEEEPEIIDLSSLEIIASLMAKIHNITYEEAFKNEYPRAFK